MYVVDFSDNVLAFISEYDGTTFEDPAPVSFSSVFPAALPEHSSLLGFVEAWIVGQDSERVNFYSPREETEQPVLPKSNAKGATAKKPAAAPKGVTNAQVMESLAALTDQVWLQNLLENQGVRDGVTPVAEQHGGGRPMHFAGLPSVSASLANISVFGRYPKGPPPKTKAPLEALQGSLAPAVMPMTPSAHAGVDLTGDGVASALVQQSSAITALVAHLTSAVDPLADLSLTGGGGTSHQLPPKEVSVASERNQSLRMGHRRATFQ
jgi:hypothetical protein